ncbi:MAG TPA: exonuclease domain-containing protein [Chitinophagales bacterium]|nr:exonuclease domain-containing protein [Chitinophagales bacterium]
MLENGFTGILANNYFHPAMYAVIDVETTGGSPSVDRVIEIAVFVFDGKQVINSFSSLLNPKRPIDPYVTKLTGISNEMVKDAPSFEDIHEKILELTHEKIFVAHNVKFDFGMIRQEFKRLGIDFIRKQLDTVNLSRKVIPGFNSYSLGNICDSLGIEITDRHRASGDAEATVKLLQIILDKQTSQKYIEIELNHGIDLDLLPPYLSRAEIEKLPDDAGVFYYKDEVGKILYLEGAKNIRKKVITEFSKPADSPEKTRMFELMRNIDYELTGNELTAKLLSYRELKKHLPEFNKKPRIQTPTHGIYLDQEEQGFLQLKIHPLDWDQGELVLKFPSKAVANKILGKIIKDSNLHSWFALRSKMKDKGIVETKGLQNYNLHIQKAIRTYLYKHPNFFIIAEGIHPDEHSVIWIENSTYKGFGYFNPELTPSLPDNLKEVVKYDEDDVEVQKIIRSQLRKMKNSKIISY